MFPVVPHLHRRFGTFVFFFLSFLSFTCDLMTYNLCLGLTHQKSVSRSEDYLSAFSSYYYFFSLSLPFPRIIDSHSLYNANLQKWKKTKNRKKNKLYNLAREMKWYVTKEMMVLRMIVAALETVTQGLKKRLEEIKIGGRIETMQNSSL